MASFGPRGQWNSSICPREYKLEAREHSMLTTAEFYGGLDGKCNAFFLEFILKLILNIVTPGLLIGLRMKNLDGSSYLKLSSVLEMYYSDNGIHGDSKYRGCNRLFNYIDPTIIDLSVLKEQVNKTLVVTVSQSKYNIFVL